MVSCSDLGTLAGRPGRSASFSPPLAGDPQSPNQCDRNRLLAAVDAKRGDPRKPTYGATPRAARLGFLRVLRCRRRGRDPSLRCVERQRVRRHCSRAARCRLPTAPNPAVVAPPDPGPECIVNGFGGQLSQSSPVGPGRSCLATHEAAVQPRIRAATTGRPFRAAIRARWFKLGAAGLLRETQDGQTSLTVASQFAA